MDKSRDCYAFDEQDQEGLRPLGDVKSLEAAVELFAPFDSDEDRASTRRNLVGLVGLFLEHRTASARAPRVAQVRRELKRLSASADAILSLLKELSAYSRQAIENYARRDSIVRGHEHPDKPRPSPQTGELPQLAWQLAALAVFADEAASDCRDRGGAKVNVETKLHGQPLRFLAFWSADYIHAYHHGQFGVRPRPHLRVTGYPSGPVYQLTACLAAYALGEAPESGLAEVVERAVRDWREDRDARELWRLADNSGLHGQAQIKGIDGLIRDRTASKIASKIASRLHGHGKGRRRSSSRD
jgi:hypothetical protein